MKKITAFLILASIALIVWISDATVPQTQTTLKSYFQTGDRPTQAQYDELIDTMFWYIGQTYTNAQYAAQQAANLQTIYQGYVNFTISVGATITNSIGNSFNVANVSIVSQGSVVIAGTNNGGGGGISGFTKYKCNIVFSNALPGVNYYPTYSSPATAAIIGANFATAVRIDGFGNGIQTPYTFTTTNFIFYFDSDADANLNALNVRVMLQ